MSLPTSPNPRQVLELFDRITRTESSLKQLRPPGPAFSRRRVYTLEAVVRLMILQRLMAKFTLSRAVQCFAEQVTKPLSLSAAAYCRARQKLSKLVARQVLQQIVEHLRGWLPPHPVLADRAVFVLDGSTLSVPHSASLAKAYPPHRNQHGAPSHWPLLRLVVLQDVQSGLALCPQWGPETDSEQTLALRALDGLPSGALVIGDRNFGIFGVAYAADRQGHPTIIRLTKVRAERLAASPIEPGYDQEVSWRPTRWDTCGGPFDAQASVIGRLLCIAPSDPKHKEPIYLFSTLQLPAENIQRLYALRWNVETDLRSIKQSVNLQQLSARSPDLLEKELLFAFAAYNLVRAVICLAAEKAQVPPRRISFTNVYTLLETFASDLYAHRACDAAHPFWNRLIAMAAQYKLPNRTKPRSYPRQVWPKAKTYPAKHAKS